MGMTLFAALDSSSQEVGLRNSRRPPENEATIRR